METIYNTNIKQYKVSSLLKFLILIVIISFFARDGLGKNIPILLFIFLYLFGFMILKRDEILLYFIFLIPLSIGPLLYYLHVVFGLFFLIKNFKYIKINKIILISMILILWESVHLLPSAILGYNESIIKLMGFALCLFVTVSYISNDKLRGNFVDILFSWCYGFASFCGILLFRYVSKFGINNFTMVVRRFGWIPGSIDTTSTSLLINPNALGKLVILTVFCLLTLLRLEKKYTLKITVFIVYFIIFGIMSGSRGFILIGIILSLLYIFDILYNFNGNKKELRILIFVFIFVIIFATNCMESTLEMFSRRIESDDISGSRFEIYKEYMQVLSRSPYLIFGSGMQDYTEKFHIIYSTHNFFIEIITIWGIIGLLIVTIWFISLYRSMNIKSLRPRKTVSPYLPLMGLILSAQFGQFFISYYDTFPTLILVFLNIKYADTMINKC